MRENEDAFDKKKAHRDRHSGRKAEKKKSKGHNLDAALTDKQKNPKAFTFNSAVRAERRFRRKQDIDTKKHHIPIVDRSPIEPPPILIAVVGPPKVGKTTLINNLIKLFSRSPLSEIKGPVTIVTGKKRRITFIECNNDINSMIDLAKVCDLALLLCDASFGFEMEIFEFLNICQVHGMPRIMGILTHLDLIKNSKTLKNTKKLLKHRFWTEVYPGAKLFYLSGIIHGQYLRNEVKNLGRFISVMKFRPLLWRQNHSYLLGDRYEDLTNQELIRQNSKCDRTISLYGYVRGVPLKSNNSIHIAGFGDLRIKDMSYLPDPCPLPDELKKRALVEKEKLIYAPFSGVGGIVFDKDAVYIEVSHNQLKKAETETESSALVANLYETKETVDVKMLQPELQIFNNGQILNDSDNDDDDDLSDEDNELISNDVINKKTSDNVDDLELEKELKQLRRMKNYQEEVVVEDSGRIRRKVIFEDDDNNEENVKVKSVPNKPLKAVNPIKEKIQQVLSNLEKNQLSSEEEEDDDDDDELSMNVEEKSSSDEDCNDDAEEMAVIWKNNLVKKAQDAYFDRVQNSQNLMKLVYGVFDQRYQQQLAEAERNDAASSLIEENNEIGEIFKKVSREQMLLKSEKDSLNLLESSLIFPWDTPPVRDWTSLENKELIKNCFVTGKWKESEDAAELLRLDDHRDDLSDIDGDFEDLETGVVHVAKEKAEKPDLKRKSDDQDDREALAEKKSKLKEKFNAEYDNADNSNTYYDELKLTAEKQAQLNKTVFENMPDEVRVQVEGFRPGMYVRIEIEKVPAEFIENFDPTYPLVIGSLNMGEENVGYVNVKVKKHRWYSKILKTGDPLIISMGWRRFQTIPLYSKLEDDLKYRYLKYTPEHLACNAHFWGPITPQGTGFLAVQRVDSDNETIKKLGFRIAATGSVHELDKSTQIMKNLKLIGYPLKIYKKTAFIKDMFSSALEVAKFEGARIKTVSGIRGQIKKAASKPEGCFRATFEDKILLSDIVFCRTWYKVDVPQFYNPVTTLLLPPEQKNQWKGIRTAGEVKREKNIKNPFNADSLYTPIMREDKPSKPLIVPAKLQKALPFRDKPNHGVKLTEKLKRIERVAVIREPQEQKIANMLKMIKSTYQHKQAKLKEETRQRVEKHRQEILGREMKRNTRIKAKKKIVFRAKSKSSAKGTNNNSKMHGNTAEE